MYKVRISTQVESFLRRVAPEPRRKLKGAIGGLARQQGDVKVLEDDLAGFWRLRVGRFRVVFCYTDIQTIDCIFVEERRLVYEVFGALLKEKL